MLEFIQAVSGFSPYVWAVIDIAAWYSFTVARIIITVIAFIITVRGYITTVPGFIKTVWSFIKYVLCFISWESPQAISGFARHIWVVINTLAGYRFTASEIIITVTEFITTVLGYIVTVGRVWQTVKRYTTTVLSFIKAVLRLGDDMIDVLKNSFLNGR